MNTLWILAGAVSAGAAVVAIWRVIQPPTDHHPQGDLHGRRLEKRSRLLRECWWYRPLLELARIGSSFIRGKRLSEAGKRLDLKLIQAGDALGVSAQEFLGLSLVVAVLFVAVIGTAVALVAPVWLLIAIIVSALCGYALPLIYLDDLVSRRSQLIDRELPYVLDALCISLSGGQSFFNSFQRLLGRRRGEPSPLIEELSIVHAQLKLGCPLEDALGDFDGRTTSTFVADLAAAISQSEDIGVELEGTFQSQAAAMRIRRTQLTERYASEAPIRFLLPLSFVFMSILVLVLGTPLINFIRGEVF